MTGMEGLVTFLLEISSQIVIRLFNLFSITNITVEYVKTSKLFAISDRVYSTVVMNCR